MKLHNTAIKILFSYYNRSGLTTLQIAEVVGKSGSTVCQIRNVLYNKGYLRKIQRGQYARNYELTEFGSNYCRTHTPVLTKD